MKLKAFTLVELIVVVTILGILATVGFVAYSSYLSGVRDTNRISSLNAISDGMEMYRTSHKLPLPDKNIEVRASGSLIAWQGFAGRNVLQSIEYSKGGKDPKSDTYFSYYLTKNKKSYQLMAFLEDSEIEEIATSTPTVSANEEFIDYSLVFPKTYGKKLGILTDTNNQPIHEIFEITESGAVDIVNTQDTYKAFLSDDFQITGTGGQLQFLEKLALAGGVLNSCKKLLETNPTFRGKDGYYYINLDGPTKAYCDMTDKGGGWTRYVDIKGNYSMQDAKNCWLGKYSSTNIDCFNPNQYNFVVRHYKVNINNQNYYNKFTTDIPSKIYQTSTSVGWKCKGGKEYMSVMKPHTYPNSQLDGIEYVWLGLNYCDHTQIEVGGYGAAGGNTYYYNYSSDSAHGPTTHVGFSNAVASQLYIR